MGKNDRISYRLTTSIRPFTVKRFQRLTIESVMMHPPVVLSESSCDAEYGWMSPLHDKKGRALARPEVTPTGFKPVTF